MNVPGLVVQGDTYTWATTLPDYPPGSGWVLTTTFRAETGSALDVVAVAQPDGSYLSTLTGTASGAMVAGLNAWSARVSKGTEGHTLCVGRSVVTVPLSTQPPDSIMTPAERFLEALLAIGPTVMANGYVEMMFDGAKSVFRSLDEYMRALAAAREAVRLEQEALDPARGLARTILTTFVRPRI